MAAAPRTLAQLQNFEIRTRSDYATYCQGVDNVADALALEVLTTADDMYRRLAASGDGGRYSAKQRAWRATRPLRVSASELRGGGRMALRAFRVYMRMYADMISPAKTRTKFDHKK